SHFLPLAALRLSVRPFSICMTMLFLSTRRAHYPLSIARNNQSFRFPQDRQKKEIHGRSWFVSPATPVPCGSARAPAQPLPPPDQERSAMSARISLLSLLCVLLLTGPVVSAENDNPLIDYDGFVKQAIAVGKLRENRRV